MHQFYDKKKKKNWEVKSVLKIETKSGVRQIITIDVSHVQKDFLGSNFKGYGFWSSTLPFGPT